MKKLSYLFLIVFITQIGCEKNVIERSMKKDGQPPAAVVVEKIIPLSGAVEIQFKQPTDIDLLCVRASYINKKGKKLEAKVSRFKTSITLEGFGDTDEYEAQLIAEDKGGNLSEPTVITVKPGEPAISTVMKELTVEPDFGGVSINFINEAGDNIAIILLADDSLGNFAPLNTFYTDLKEGAFSTHGMKAEETKVGVYVRDRWGNISDTLITNVEPLFEIQLDRTKMKEVILPGDAPLGYKGNVSYLFDGIVTNSPGYYHTGDAAKMPQQFTFDMGVTAKLSRLVWFMRQGFYFSLHNPRKVEIWGSNNPNPDGTYDDSWILLATHEQIKPSGLPAGELSQADNEAAVAGETISFPLGIPKVRYIRFRTLRNWSDGSYCNFNEIQMFGDPN